MLSINTIKRVALPDTSLAFCVATHVGTFLSRRKVVSVSHAATVDKLLSTLSGCVVEEAWKVSLANSWLTGKIATACRALKVDKKTNKLFFRAILCSACGLTRVSKTSTRGKCALLTCGFDFLYGSQHGLI